MGGLLTDSVPLPICDVLAEGGLQGAGRVAHVRWASYIDALAAAARRLALHTSLQLVRHDLHRSYSMSEASTSTCSQRRIQFAQRVCICKDYFLSPHHLCEAVPFFGHPR